MLRLMCSSSYQRVWIRGAAADAWRQLPGFTASVAFHHRRAGGNKRGETYTESSREPRHVRFRGTFCFDFARFQLPRRIPITVNPFVFDVRGLQHSTKACASISGPPQHLEGGREKNNMLEFLPRGHRTGNPSALIHQRLIRWKMRVPQMVRHSLPLVVSAVL